MISLKERIVEKLDNLPEPYMREVLNFVEFLMWRTLAQDEPLLAIAGGPSGATLSAEEIERALWQRDDL